MSNRIYPACFSILFCLGGNLATADSWQSLLDAELSDWEVWAGVPHETVPIDWPHKSDDGKSGKPLGLGWNERDLYRVSEASGEPVLRISGEIYAGLTSRESRGNYHLRMEFRWGDEKWEPRLERLRDSGILYHATGEHGAFWNVWMRSLEFQIQEGDCGDLYLLAGPSAHVAAQPPASGQRAMYDPASPPLQFGHGKPGVVRHGPSAEKPHGEWNVVEILTIGDRAVHLVNGELVLALQDARINRDGALAPLTAGRIQIQSEGAEVFYRRVEIRPLDAFPVDISVATGWSK